MKVLIFLPCILTGFLVHTQNSESVMVNPSVYLNDLRTELQNEWPQNRTINIVLHGHSVPAGFFKTPNVNTLSAYPNLFLKKLKKIYLYAVVNVIVTAIGGENSVKVAERFEKDVLVHNPDVILIRNNWQNTCRR